MSLIIKNLNKNFKDFRVLNNISLELKKGEITGLLELMGLENLHKIESWLDIMMIGMVKSV